jgi:hypothetical protein
VNILIACEHSGAVRDAFTRRGHHAVSCDLLPSETPGHHYQGDVRDILHHAWDTVIAFPDCTYLCGSGWHWVARGRIEADGRPRMAHVEEALAFARMFIDGPETAHIPLRAVENPVGRLSTLVRKPDQIIQPHWFGDDASKATCLWLQGLPKLTPTRRVSGRQVMLNGKTVERWANQTDSGQNKLAPSVDRWKLRSATYTGIAEAMAEQWGGIKQPTNGNRIAV